MGLEQWPEKKIKLEEEATSEILVADPDLESGPDASDVEDYFGRKKKNSISSSSSSSKPQQKSP